MAGVTNREFWDFRVKTRAQFTKLAEQIANIDTSGGGGISELTSKMVVDALGYTPYNANNPADYITSAALTPYALKADIPSLVGYATEDFVNSKLGDYATQYWVTANYATVNSVTAIKNTLTGQIGAVGASVEQLAATKLDSSYFTLANIKSTLGISDWALAATKPSYAWSEITSRPTALSQFTDDVVAGKYLPLSGGTLNGSIIATSFIGNLTGNADSATQLATPRKLWGQRFDGTGDVSGDITANKFIGYLRGDIIYDNGVDEGHFIGLGSNGVGVKGLLNFVYGNFPILFYTNGFERMRIGEYVGIGNTSPTERLDVSGNIKASGNINATSITINGVTITASNGSITVNGNVLATGAITAKAVG